jgi:hypothetical protein
MEGSPETDSRNGSPVTLITNQALTPRAPFNAGLSASIKWPEPSPGQRIHNREIAPTVTLPSRPAVRVPRTAMEGSIEADSRNGSPVTLVTNQALTPKTLIKL